MCTLCISRGRPHWQLNVDKIKPDTFVCNQVGCLLSLGKFMRLCPVNHASVLMLQ